MRALVVGTALALAAAVPFAASAQPAARQPAVRLSPEDARLFEAWIGAVRTDYLEVRRREDAVVDGLGRQPAPGLAELPRNFRNVPPVPVRMRAFQARGEESSAAEDCVEAMVRFGDLVAAAGRVRSAEDPAFIAAGQAYLDPAVACEQQFSLPEHESRLREAVPPPAEPDASQQPDRH